MKIVIVDYREQIEWLRGFEIDLTSTEQTMREYQELAAKMLEEIAKYRAAPVVGYTTTNEDGDLSMLFFDELSRLPRELEVSTGFNTGAMVCLYNIDKDGMHVEIVEVEPEDDDDWPDEED